MDLISDSLAYVNSSRFFKSTYRNWKKEVKKTLLAGDSFKNSFYSKGDDYLKFFGFLGVIPSIALFAIIINSAKSSFRLFSGSLILCILILGAVSGISLILPQKIAGQWTTYGREYYAQWRSFKKYIEDYSLIKEYSPESVKLWNRYLVYATALGVADEVENAMKFSIPYDQLRGSDLYSFHYYNSPTAMLKNALDTALEPD